MRRRARRWVFAMVTVAVMTAAAVLYLRSHEALRSIELATFDARMDARGSRKAPRDVVVVAIDEQTFGELGERWPLRRSHYARLLDRLRAARVRLVALDLQFTEPSEADEDFALFDGIKRARPVVLATTAATAGGRTAVLGGDGNVRAAGAVVGMSTFPVDPNGVIRRMQTSVGPIRSFASVANDAARGRRSDAHGIERDGVWIDFRGPPGTFRTIPLWRALNDRRALSGLRDAIVVVGASAPSLQDVHATSAPGGNLMSGAELQANAITTARDGFPLRNAAPAADLALIILLAALAPLTASFFRQRWAFVAGFGGLALLVVGSQIAFNSGRVIELTYPALAGGLAVAGSAGVAYLDEHVERDRLRRLFADFEPDVVEAVLASEPGQAGVALGAEEIVGGYRIERLIGQGGMGVVYEATQLALGRRVALKLIRPAVAADPVVRERFKRESRLAAAVEHPNVIPVYEAGEDGDILYIAMRFIRGDDLASVIAREGPLEPRRAAWIVTQIAAALDAAHAHGLVHRDVKPSNVLVAAGRDPEHVYLTDFGLTKQVGAADRLTRAGRFVGTLDYMAPEAIRGRDVGPAADIYALGCVLYELLSGQVPYPEEADADVIVRHLEGQPPQLEAPGVSAFNPVVARAMAREPEGRYGTAGELAAAGERAADASPEGTDAAPLPPRPERPVTSASTRPA